MAVFVDMSANEAPKFRAAPVASDVASALGSAFLSVRSAMAAEGELAPMPQFGEDVYGQMARQLRKLEQAYQAALEAEEEEAAAEKVLSFLHSDSDLEKVLSSEDAKEVAIEAASRSTASTKVLSNIHMQTITRSRGEHAREVWESAALWRVPGFVQGSLFATPYLEIWGAHSAAAAAEGPAKDAVVEVAEAAKCRLDSQTEDFESEKSATGRSSPKGRESPKARRESPKAESVNGAAGDAVGHSAVAEDDLPKPPQAGKSPEPAAADPGKSPQPAAAEPGKSPKPAAAEAAGGSRMWRLLSRSSSNLSNQKVDGFLVDEALENPSDAAAQCGEAADASESTKAPEATEATEAEATSPTGGEAGTAADAEKPLTPTKPGKSPKAGTSWSMFRGRSASSVKADDTAKPGEAAGTAAADGGEAPKAAESSKDADAGKSPREGEASSRGTSPKAEKVGEAEVADAPKSPKAGTPPNGGEAAAQPSSSRRPFSLWRGRSSSKVDDPKADEAGEGAKPDKIDQAGEAATKTGDAAEAGEAATAGGPPKVEEAAAAGAAAKAQSVAEEKEEAAMPSPTASPPPEAPAGPQLALTMLGHEECGGHTWYMIECHVKGLTEPAMVLRYDASGERPPAGFREAELELRWRAPRRLLHLRESLHDPLKLTLGTSYTSLFGSAPFARAGAPPGTTARLAAWLNKLAQLINKEALPAGLLSRTLLFFHGPPLPEQVAAQPCQVPQQLAAPAGEDSSQVSPGNVDEDNGQVSSPQVSSDNVDQDWGIGSSQVSDELPHEEFAHDDDVAVTAAAITNGKAELAANAQLPQEDSTAASTQVGEAAVSKDAVAADKMESALSTSKMESAPPTV